MAKSRTNFAYLTYDDMQQKLSDGTLNQYDVIYTKDSLETYIVTDELKAVALKSRVYAFSSIREAISKLNQNIDTYEGQLVSIYNGTEYCGYIVNLKNGAFTVTSLHQLSSIDYNTLGNRPINNMVGESDNPLIISSLSNGTYSVTGHFKIAKNDVTIHLNPNPTLFLISHNDNDIFIKMIATKEIIDYQVTGDISAERNQYITEDYLRDNGYTTTSYVDEKIMALDLVNKKEMITYVEELIAETIESTIIPLIDERIDKKIIPASTGQIVSLFSIS